MVHGIIEDFYIAVKGAEKSVVKLLVKNEEEAEEDTCTVCAEIPNEALKYEMIKAGSAIGWKGANVFIDIEGVEGILFTKVGNSGDEITFYEHLRSLADNGR